MNLGRIKDMNIYWVEIMKINNDLDKNRKKIIKWDLGKRIIICYIR